MANMRFIYSGTGYTSANCVKFLGIYVDQNLRWSDHVDYVSKILNKSRYALSRIRDSMPLESLLTVYYSYVYCQMSYNVILWGNSADSFRIFLCQKRIIRTLLNLPLRESCRQHFIRHKILTFPCIYILNCILYIKDNINSFKTHSAVHSYPTRNNDLLALPKHKTAKFQRGHIYQGIKLFNHLPMTLRHLNLISLKKCLKKLLLSKGYYGVEEFMMDDTFL
ncbi:hypothetical protein WA026_007409 [Henosepilachna vigintioctopunctata]|uniref:Uncharacterized protein n=1 Tax=Henosepilachna vigintioctopunctata TaxID=420089 RepID=A0AAW1UXL5_9CUCU